MRARSVAPVLALAAIGLAGFASTTFANALNHVPPARAACSVLSGHPCHPSFCSVFHGGPCFPYVQPPLGETLRLTIVSTNEDSTDSRRDGTQTEQKSAEETNESNSSEDRRLDSIRDIFGALRACWVPPPKDEAHHGMEYTIRFAFRRDGEMIAPPRMTYASHDAPAEVRDKYRNAIDQALRRCTPLHFTDAMGGAVAGRPIAIRFVDERTIDPNTGK